MRYVCKNVLVYNVIPDMPFGSRVAINVVTNMNIMFCGMLHVVCYGHVTSK